MFKVTWPFVIFVNKCQFVGNDTKQRHGYSDTLIGSHVRPIKWRVRISVLE